jgi:ribosomal protein S13
MEEETAEVLEEVLEHYGIKGMRWGVRRKVGSDGLVKGGSKESSSSKSKSDDDGEETQKSADYERATKAYAKAQEKGVQALSNDEIKAIEKRVEAERKFSQLTSEQHSDLKSSVERLRLEKEYRGLKSEAAASKKGAGRKIVDSMLSGAAKQANELAAAQGKKLIADMMADGAKKTATKSATKGAFKVNPAKVKINKIPGSGLSR